MKKYLAMLGVAVVLTACETTGGTQSQIGDNEAGAIGVDAGTGSDTTGTDGDGTETFGLEGAGEGLEGTTTFALDECEPECEYPREALNNPDSLLAKRLIFFGFDSDAVADEFKNVLIAHAKYLQNNPEVTVRLEGHTDERGTREYNLALSEKRSQSVRRFLMLYGARSESIGVYGFGEELPLALGSNETAWAENRRVELVYDQNN